MIVLLDIEWIGDQEKHMTQLSAMRVTPYWWAMERMDIIVRPEDGCAFDSEHVAYGGYPESKFAEGVAEEEGIISFSEWLQPDDTIWVWAATNQKYLQELWSKYISDEVPNIAVQSGRARGLASKQGLTDNSPYDILSSLGKDPPYPEHRSANDIEVMCHLFSRLQHVKLDVVRVLDVRFGVLRRDGRLDSASHQLEVAVGVGLFGVGRQRGNDHVLQTDSRRYHGRSSRATHNKVLLIKSSFSVRQEARHG